MSNILDGCHATRNMVNIMEIKCPKCGELIEVLVRDNLQIEDSTCEKCGYLIPEETKYK